MVKKTPNPDSAPDPRFIALWQALGHALTNWALLERNLASWFATVGGMPRGLGMVIFYTPHGFQPKLDLLAAILPYTELSDEHVEFTRIVLGKARNYADFRNSMVHTGPVINYPPDPHIRLLPPTSSQSMEEYAELGLTAPKLRCAASNFAELANIVLCADLGRLDARLDPPQPTSQTFQLPTLLQRLEQLPNAPGSAGPNRTKAGKLLQQLAAARKLPGKRKTHKGR